MTGPAYWPPQAPPTVPPGVPPAFPPPGGQASVAWTAGMPAAPPPAPARPPADVGAVLRLVAAGLLLVAGVLTTIACFLTVFEIEMAFGEPPFEATAWSDSGERFPTPIRWGIPMVVVAAALLAGGVLLLLSRWSASLRGLAAAVAAAGVGGAVAVGWMVSGYVGDLAGSLRELNADLDIDQGLRTGGGVVLLLVSLWTALAAVVPLVLAPVLDAVRARAAVGGGR